jgi:hypothetical protein
MVHLCLWRPRCARNGWARNGWARNGWAVVSQSAQQRQHKAEEASARASARLARRQAETEAAARAAEEQVKLTIAIVNPRRPGLPCCPTGAGGDNWIDHKKD